VMQKVVDDVHAAIPDRRRFGTARG
jgi:hypothetical protein